MTNTPSPELVTEAFLRIAMPNCGVTTTLPKLTVPDPKGGVMDNWGGKELWITPTGYGTGLIHNLPHRKAVVSVDVWAKPINKPRHWGKATNLAQEIISYATDWYSNIKLSMPYQGYYSVSLTSLTALTDSRRIENDPQELARVQFNLQLAYTILSYSLPFDPETPTSPGGGGTLRFDRNTPSTVWGITHNLGYYPVIQVFDTNDDEIEALPHHLNENSFIIEFNEPMVGYVVVS